MARYRSMLLRSAPWLVLAIAGVGLIVGAVSAAPPSDNSNLVGGLSTAAAPVHVANEKHALSLDLSGQLRTLLPVGAGATQVQGTAADAAAPVGNPVQIGGVDSVGLMQRLLVSGDGAVAIFDSGLSITVDAPAGTPVAMRLSDGAAFQTTSELDLDTGAGAVARVSVGLAGAAAGGPVALEGTTANGLEVDVTRLNDGGNSVTVDAPVGTPVFTRLSDGAAAQGTVANPLLVRLSDGVDVILVTAAGELNVLATAQPGVDLGDVTLTAGTAAVGTVTAIGTGADGTAVSGNPIQVAGVDAGGLLQRVLTDATGAVQVDVESVPAPLSTTGGGAEATALRVTMANDSTGILAVGGRAADGAAPVGNPVAIAGADSTGTIQRLLTDAAGAVAIFDSGSVISVDDAAGSLTVDSAQLPAALVGGRLDVVVGAALPTGANTIGDVTVTEFPAAAALADDAANPTTTTVGAVLLALDGAGIDRLTGNSANGLDVDVTRLSALVTGTATVGSMTALGQSGEPFVQGTGVRTPQTMRVTIATNDVVPVSGLTAVGTAAGDLAKLEDAVHGSGDAGIAAWLVRVGDTNSLAGTVGDYSPATVDSTAAVRVSQDGWAPIASDFVNLTADVQGVAGAAGLRLGWISVRESAGTAAASTVIIRHGITATSPVIAHYELAANESARDLAPPGGWLVPSGVFVDVVGTATLDVTFGTAVRTP